MVFPVRTYSSTDINKAFIDKCSELAKENSFKEFNKAFRKMDKTGVSWMAEMVIANWTRTGQLWHSIKERSNEVSYQRDLIDGIVDATFGSLDLVAIR